MLGKNSCGKIIFISGLPGSGKTTLGKGLVARLGSDATLIDGDAVFNRITGMLGGARGIDVSDAVHAKCFIQLMGGAVRAARQGKTAIVTDLFDQQKSRHVCEWLPRLLGIRSHAIWLLAPNEITQRRTEERKARRRSGHQADENFSIADAWPCDPDKFAAAVSSKWIRIDASGSRGDVLEKTLACIQPAQKLIDLDIARPQAGQGLTVARPG